MRKTTPHLFLPFFTVVHNRFSQGHANFNASQHAFIILFFLQKICLIKQQGKVAVDKGGGKE